MPVQNDGIAGCHFDFEDLKEAIFHHHVMMRFLVHSDYGRRLGGEWQGRSQSAARHACRIFKVFS